MFMPYTSMSGVIFITLLREKMQMANWFLRAVGRITVKWECTTSTALWKIFLKNWIPSENGSTTKMISFSISCLLYTTDAADEEDSVDLGGRRTIKKKKKKKTKKN